MTNLTFWVLLLPLLGFIILGLAGRLMSRTAILTVALVGLASYLLIGFWYQRQAAVAAAKKALVINIIGDFGLMLAIFLMFVSTYKRDGVGVLNYFPNPGAGFLTGVFTSLGAAGHNS